MIAIILAAGKGSRLASIHSCSSKCMLPIEGKPLLEKKLYHLSHCDGLKKIYIVIRIEEEEIPAYFGDNYFGIPIEYRVQDQKHPGIINAVYSVVDLSILSDEDILINLGDEYYEELDYNSLIKEHKIRKSSVTPIVIYSDEECKIKCNYTINIYETGEIIDAIEKPLKIFNNYIGCGTMAVSRKLLKDFAVDCNYKFEEKQLVDWIKFAIATNRHCYVYKAETRYCNLNSQKDMEYFYSLSYKETAETICSMFRKVVYLYPERIAVCCEGQSISFKELDEKSNVFAYNLLREKFILGDCVALMCARSLEHIIAFIGVLKAGGYYLTLDENLPKKTLEYMLEKADAKLLISHNGLAQSINIKSKIIDFTMLIKRQEKHIELKEHTCEQAFILFTSGSTGTPKGVVIRKSSIVNMVISTKELIFDICRKEHLGVGVCASFSFNFSVQQLYSSLLYGHTLHIIPTTAMSCLEELIFYMNQVDVCDITPQMISHITKYLKMHPEVKISTKHLVSGGEELKKATIHRLFQQCSSITVTNMYGLAECTGPSAMFYLDKKIEEELKRIPIGKPIRNTRIYILDMDRKIMSTRKIGDIWLEGDSVCLGYYCDEERNNRVFDTDIIDDNCKMFKTGDIGYLALDGNYYFGREDK